MLGVFHTNITNKGISLRYGASNIVNSSLFWHFELLLRKAQEQMARFKNENRDIAEVMDLFNKAIFKYSLIDDGDRILIGLSGGKDSLALLELLAKRSRIARPSFTVMAAHIEMVNIGYKTDTDYLRSVCDSLGVEFTHATASYEMSTDKRKSPCFLCSWNRRKALFSIAQANNCNKLALGHHMDDIIETLYMNMMFQGAFSTMPPLLKMRKFDMSIIRPLCLIPESLIEEMASKRQFKRQVKQCPFEHESSRAVVKKMLKQMEEANPSVRYNIWGSMSNMQTELLPGRLK